MMAKPLETTKVPLRIAVVGPITGGSLPIAAAAARAFTGLGHQVTFIDSQGFAPALAAAKQGPAELRSQREVETFIAAAAEMKRRLHVARPQLALFLAQAPVLSAADLDPLRDRDVPSVFWFVEDFRVFTYWKRAAPRFDHVWTIQEEPFLSLLTAAGVKSAACVPLACEPAAGDGFARVVRDVSFVGTGYPNRVARLAAIAPPSLEVFGPLFAREARVAPFVRHDGVLPHEALAPIFSGSSINLNLSSTIEPRLFNERKDFVNPRTFEICGSGGFQLAERLIPLETFFVPDVEVATFASDEEARDKIRFYLSHEVARSQIAQRGAARARAHHTYVQRLGLALARLLERDGERVKRAA